MIDIASPRLLLRLVPLAGLAATADGDRVAARRFIGEGLTAEWFAAGWVARQRLTQWLSDPAFRPWSLRAIIRRDTGDVIGGINAHQAPSADSPGVEVGYLIFESFRRQGYASEAFAAYGDWALAQGVASFRLSVAAGDSAALAFAASLGAAAIGSWANCADGAGELFSVSLPLARRT